MRLRERTGQWMGLRVSFIVRFIQMSEDEVAYGFIKVANEAMCRPIRLLTQARGFDTKTHVLSCFGGAGAQHGTLTFTLLA